MDDRTDKIVSSQDWIEYFSRNRSRLIAIPWEKGVDFNRDEFDAVAESLREFQLGESGEGRHFRKVAARWAAKADDLHYSSALMLFIAEEQRHARDLGRVMDLAGIPRAESLAVDSVFRVLRHLAGLELCIMILVTAEIIAQVYYRGLRDATRSVVLRTLCRQILRDEVQHVRFQCQRLAIIRKNRWQMMNRAMLYWQWAFLFMTSLIIWRKHGPVLRRGGISLTRFWFMLGDRMSIASSWMHADGNRVRGSRHVRSSGRKPVMIETT